MEILMGIIKKLNNHNYSTWLTWILSYLEWHDLWEITKVAIPDHLMKQMINY
jgi:hypothetical protein